MAEKNNATCSICGSGYHVCRSCKDSIKLQPWKIHCCSADCYKVFQVVRGFSTGVYTKNEFKSKLKSIDLSNLENFREHIKALIKDALKKDMIVEKVVEPTNLVEKANKAEITMEDSVVVKDAAKAERAENVVRPNYSRKRNYKIEAE